MTSFPEIICGTAVAVALVGWVAYHFSLARELTRARRETSRFPMFAARDQLVGLVASDKVPEGDPGWRSMYEGVTFLLDMHQRLHILDFAWHYWRYLVEVERSPRLKNRIRKVREAEEYAAKRFPELAQLRAGVNEALGHLMVRRTAVWHIAVLLAFLAAAVVFVVMPSTALSSIRSAAGRATRVTRGLLNPNLETVTAWPGDDTCPA